MFEKQTHSYAEACCQVEYNVMSVTEANKYINDEENPENKELFHAKRDRLIELIVEKGHNYRIAPDDFEGKEKWWHLIPRENVGGGQDPSFDRIVSRRAFRRRSARR